MSTHPAARTNSETVCIAYGEVIALYGRARAVTDTLLMQLNGGQLDPALVERLQQLLDAAQALQDEAAPALAALGPVPPTSVQMVVEQSCDLMKEILDSIRQAEARAGVVLEELSPQLENAGRSRQMQRAYGANR
jgi:hypothetical protein